MSAEPPEQKMRAAEVAMPIITRILRGIASVLPTFCSVLAFMVYTYAVTVIAIALAWSYASAPFVREIAHNLSERGHYVHGEHTHMF